LAAWGSDLDFWAKNSQAAKVARRLAAWPPDPPNITEKQGVLG
ncbi:unnamed protein product, partial [marine sediment metagenome]